MRSSGSIASWFVCGYNDLCYAVDILQGYGLTETGSSCHVMGTTYEEIKEQHGTTGPPLYGEYIGDFIAHQGLFLARCRGQDRLTRQ